MNEKEKSIRDLIHQLQNPVSVISSTTQFCLDNVSLDDNLRQNLKVIRRNIEKINSGLKEFRKFIK